MTDLQPAAQVVGRKMPALDCLRGIAIAGVVVYHGVAGGAPPDAVSGWTRTISKVSVYGQHGVTLFFVLSGFLITGGLLDSRSKADHYYRDFYVRRLLRIVPVYLAMLLVLMVSRSITVGYLFIALLFLANFSSPFPHERGYGPLWSLSVEEQFYLVWPWIVRRLTTRRFMIFCTCILFVSPLLRLLVLAVPTRLHDIHTKTPLISDTFAMGAVLAVLMRDRLWTIARLRHLAMGLVAMGVVVAFLFALGSTVASSARYIPAVELSMYTLLFGGLVLWSVLDDRLARTRTGRAMAFLGEISYGLYLVHQFVVDVYDRLVDGTRLADVRGSMVMLVLRLLVCSGVSIGLAAISRFTFEQRFLDLKDRFAPRRIAATMQRSPS
jgi:peptidoglycan/LPS O-acetylase OafA/YrhL